MASRGHQISATERQGSSPALPLGLYTPEQRKRRDETKWTLVQGILAPLQFAVFAISLALVIRTLWTGEGYALATSSIILKTLILYVIMITGAIWEKVVFDQYLMAPAFFWEDIFSFAVLALHTAYLLALWGGWLAPTSLLLLALAAYAAYVINAVQFILKLRAARLQGAQISVSNSLVTKESPVEKAAACPQTGSAMGVTP